MPRGVVDETPPFRDDYQLALVEADYFKDKLRPKQFLHIDQSECILCEGCVDICPWKCIHYLSLEAINEAVGVSDPQGGRHQLRVLRGGRGRVHQVRLVRRPLPDQRHHPRKVRGLAGPAGGRGGALSRRGR